MWSIYLPKVAGAANARSCICRTFLHAQEALNHLSAQWTVPMARSFEATRLLLLFAFLFAFWENAQVTERRSAKSLMSQICQEWLAATASRVDLTGPRELMGFVKLAHENVCTHKGKPKQLSLPTTTKPRCKIRKSCQCGGVVRLELSSLYTGKKHGIERLPIRRSPAELTLAKPRAQCRSRRPCHARRMPSLPKRLAGDVINTLRQPHMKYTGRP